MIVYYNYKNETVEFKIVQSFASSCKFIYSSYKMKLFK